MIQKKLKFDIPFFRKDFVTSNDLKKIQKNFFKTNIWIWSKNIFIIKKSNKKLKGKIIFLKNLLMEKNLMLMVFLQ